MPTTVNVKINTVQHTQQTSQAGNELNYVEVTGYDSTNNKGFKKRFFATKKDGTATKNAETADSLKQDDWVEFTLDDTSYNNVQTLKKINEPAGMSAPSQASPDSGNPKAAGGKKGGGYKANPAKEIAIRKSVALKAAVDLVKGDQETGVAGCIEIAKQFEDYLKPTAEKPEVVTAPNGNTIENPTGQETPPAPQDDDIPF